MNATDVCARVLVCVPFKDVLCVSASAATGAGVTHAQNKNRKVLHGAKHAFEYKNLLKACLFHAVHFIHKDAPKCFQKLSFLRVGTLTQ